MSMEIKDLETFLLIVRTGSFTQAAKILHLTQPGISRRIRQLEEELQCRLFEKVGNGLIVTTDGKYLLPYAEQVVQSALTLKRAFEAKKGRLTSVTIAFSSSLAGTRYTSRFRMLGERFPNVDAFSLRMLNEEDLSLSVAKGESDIGVRFFKDDNANLAYQKLEDDPFVVVRAGQSRWAVSEQDGAVVLGKVPWLALTKLGYFMDPLTAVEELTERTCQELGIERAERIECYGFGVTKSMVESDIGVAFLPWVKVREDVESGKLCVIKLPKTPVLPLYGVHRKNEVHAEQLLEIVRYLAEGDGKE